MGRVLRWSALLVGGGAAAAALVRFWRITAIGAAYKAKILASAIFGSGRTIDVTAGRRGQRRQLLADASPSRAGRLRRTVGHRFPPRLSAAHGHLSARPGRDADRARRPRRASGRSQSGDIRSRHPGAEPRRQRATSAGASVAGRRRIAGARPCRGLGVHGARPQAPAAHAAPSSSSATGGSSPSATRPSSVPDTRFAGWSMTKSVLGALIGILVGEGRLSLHDQSLLPQWRSPDPRATIQLEDLLRMRSGLKFSEVYSDLSSDVIEMLFNRADTAAYAAEPASDRRARDHVELFERDDEHPVGARAPDCWRSRLPRLAAPGAVRSDRDGDGGDGAGPVGDFRRLFLHARHRAGLGAIRPAVSAGRRRGKDAGSFRRRWVRFSTTPTPQSPQQIYGAHWWLRLQPELGGSTSAARRIPRDAFFALGHEGQTLTVIPSLRLVVVRLGLSIYVDAWNQAAFLARLLDAL